jgi:broad specificity phosphatase PhoE
MYLFLIRHGQSEGNVTGQLQGWQDAALTPLGEQQARRTAAALSAFLAEAGITLDAIYSSPLQRARRTAEAIGAQVGVAVEPVPALREMHFGHIEGLTGAQWQERYPEILPAWRIPDNLDFQWPGGESRRAFYERVETAITSIVTRHAPTDNLAIVAHGGVISSYLAYVSAEGWHEWRRFIVDNCSISHLTLEPGQAGAPFVACLLHFNQIGHLSDADAEAVTVNPLP